MKDCTCELTELLYRADKASQSTSDFGGPLTSYSNDGESGTIDLSRSIYTEEGNGKSAGRSSAGIWEIRHCFIGGVRMNELQSDNYSLPEGWNGVEQECVRAMFWKSGITVVQNDTEASQTNTYTVRIPLEAAGSDFSASPGM